MDGHKEFGALFLKYNFSNYDLLIIAFLGVFVTKGAWFARHNFSFRGACSSKIDKIESLLVPLRKVDYEDLNKNCFHKGVVTGEGGGGQRGHDPSTLISEPNKVQQFQFHRSDIFLFPDVQKLYGPEISRFSNYIVEIDNFELGFLKRSDT